jgi:hypothetical protein
MLTHYRLQLCFGSDEYFSYIIGFFLDMLLGESLILACYLVKLKQSFGRNIYQTVGVMFICNLQTKLLQADNLTDAWYKH